MTEKIDNPIDPIQQALDNLVAKGLIEIRGYRDDKPVYYAVHESSAQARRPAKKQN